MAGLFDPNVAAAMAPTPGLLPVPAAPPVDPQAGLAAMLQTPDQMTQAFVKSHAAASALRLIGATLQDAGAGFGGTQGTAVNSAVTDLAAHAAQPLQLAQAKVRMAGLMQLYANPNTSREMKSLILSDPAAAIAAIAKNQELQNVAGGNTLGNADGPAFTAPVLGIDKDSGEAFSQTPQGITPQGQFGGGFSAGAGGIVSGRTGGFQGVTQPQQVAPGATPGTFTPSLAGSPQAPAAGINSPAATAPQGQAASNQVTPDIDALVRTAFAEGDPNPLGWKSVAATVMNRVRASGLSPSQVVAQPSQYTGFQNQRYNSLSPSDPRYRHILDAISPVVAGQEDPTGGADSYYAPAGMAGGKAPSWAAGQNGQKIGTQIFYKGLYKGAGRAAQVAQDQAAPVDASAPPPAPPGWSVGQRQPAVQIVHGSQLPGGDPNQDYKVTPTDISVIPKSFNMDTVQSTRKAFYDSAPYKSATEIVAPVNNLFSTLNSVAPGGAMSIAALDTLNKSLNPGGVVRPTTVSLFLEHLGLPEEIKSHVLGVTGNGFLSPTILRQIAQVAWTSARSHVQQAADQADKDTALAVSHGFKPDDVGETAPTMPPVPALAQDKVPPPKLRTVGKVYWGPNGPGKWTGQGWVPQ